MSRLRSLFRSEVITLHVNAQAIKLSVCAQQQKTTKSWDDVLLGADMALSSEELLNVSARGIEDGGEVCGRHLDCDFSRWT
jgi:hypothetical protein